MYSNKKQNKMGRILKINKLTTFSECSLIALGLALVLGVVSIAMPSQLAKNAVKADSIDSIRTHVAEPRVVDSVIKVSTEVAPAIEGKVTTKVTTKAITNKKPLPSNVKTKKVKKSQDRENLNVNF